MPLKTLLPRTTVVIPDDCIGPDHEVRAIDAFVDALDLPALGFYDAGSQETGAPAYPTAVLLKIYLYGYLHRVRSSRMLEAECARNIEMLWLTHFLRPSYHTISTFRTFQLKDDDGKILFCHRKALRGVFGAFRQVAKHLKLLGMKAFAVDGTKMSAQNSKKNNISEEKLDKRLSYHENRFEEYLNELDRTEDAEARGEQAAVSAETLNKALDETLERVRKLEALKNQLIEAQKENPELRQVSLTDPEARSMPLNNSGIVDVAYNVQTATDDLYYLIADYSVENVPDVHLLGKVAVAAKEVSAYPDQTEVLADKGYHFGDELDKCAKANLITYVAYPEQDYKTKGDGFRKEDFDYNEQKNVYVCPVGNELTTNGTIYDKRGRNGLVQRQFKRYTLPYAVCAACPFSSQCLTESDHTYRQGRGIERGLHEAAVVANRHRVLNHRDKYKRRQAIVEHPFGTIKRSWGFYYTLLKTKEKVSGEYALAFTAYNMRRVLNIAGVQTLIEAVKALFLSVFALRRCIGRLVPKRGLGGDVVNFNVFKKYVISLV